MLDSERLDYYIAREVIQRRRAAAATQPITVAIHIRLADCYARIIRAHHKRVSEQQGASGGPVHQ